MISNAIQWQDKPYFSEERRVLTPNELTIPGIHMVGRHHMTTAIAPLPDHFHSDCYEFTVVLEGSFNFTVDHEDYPVASGQLFITPPGQIHGTNNSPMSKGHILWFQLSVKEKNLLFLNEVASLDIQNRLELTVGSKVFSLSKVSLQIAKHLSQDLNETASPFLVANQITHLIYEMFMRVEENKKQVPDDIKRVFAYIDQEIHQEISLDALAEIANLSVSQLKQKFKAQVGTAPRNYINQLKIEQAKKGLLMGHTVTEVAMNYGFTTSSYFAVVFKRYTAYTPTEFVKETTLDLPDYFKQNTQNQG